MKILCFFEITTLLPDAEPAWNPQHLNSKQQKLTIFCILKNIWVGLGMDNGKPKVYEKKCTNGNILK